MLIRQAEEKDVLEKKGLYFSLMISIFIFFIFGVFYNTQE